MQTSCILIPVLSRKLGDLKHGHQGLHQLPSVQKGKSGGIPFQFQHLGDGGGRFGSSKSSSTMG